MNKLAWLLQHSLRSTQPAGPCHNLVKEHALQCSRTNWSAGTSTKVGKSKNTTRLIICSICSGRTRLFQCAVFCPPILCVVPSLVKFPVEAGGSFFFFFFCQFPAAEQGETREPRRPSKTKQNLHKFHLVKINKAGVRMGGCLKPVHDEISVLCLFQKELAR